MGKTDIQIHELTLEDRQILKAIILQSKKTWLIIGSIFIVIDLILIFANSFTSTSPLSVFLIILLPYIFIYLFHHLNTYKVKKDLLEGKKEIHPYLITGKVRYQDSTNKYGGTKVKYKAYSGTTKLALTEEQYNLIEKGDYIEMNIAYHSAYQFENQIIKQ